MRPRAPTHCTCCIRCARAASSARSAASTSRQLRCASIFDTTPDRPDRCSWSPRSTKRTIGFSQRCDSRTPRTPPRPGSRRGPTLVGLDERVLGQPLPQRRDQLVAPASHGPVTSTTSRLSTPGELSPGSIGRHHGVRRGVTGIGHSGTAPEQTQRTAGDVGAAAAVEGVDRTPAVAPPVHGAAQMRGRDRRPWSTRQPCRLAPRRPAAAITARTASSRRQELARVAGRRIALRESATRRSPTAPGR